VPAFFEDRSYEKRRNKSSLHPSSKKRKENQQTRDTDIYNKKTKPKPKLLWFSFQKKRRREITNIRA